MEEKREEKNLLSAFYGGKDFLKIKQCLEIGKIQFAFVKKENSQEHIDCYMEAEEFGAILMAAIKDGRLIKALMAEKAKGEEYPKAVWTSPIGGNATGNHGKPCSRYFTISPASKGEVLFTAYVYPAVKNATGAFIKESGSKPILTLRVPCSYNDLTILAYKWSFLESDYMHRKYSLANMKSDYKPKVEDTQTVSMPAETEEAIPFKETSNMTPAPVAEDEENDVPYVSSNEVSTPATSEEVPATRLKLVATSGLSVVPNKNIKVLKVNDDTGKEHRMICLLDKITDTRFSAFEQQVNERTSNSQTLEFTAEVFVKGEDIYLKKFA